MAPTILITVMTSICKPWCSGRAADADAYFLIVNIISNHLLKVNHALLILSCKFTTLPKYSMPLLLFL